LYAVDELPALVSDFGWLSLAMMGGIHEGGLKILGESKNVFPYALEFYLI